MQPIHVLLSRVLWDAEFGAAAFELGYHDRVEGRILRVPFSKTDAGHVQGGVFEIIDPEGRQVSVPLHRVRRVWREGVLIWSRDP